MKQSTLLVIALVLLGGAALWITSLKLENYELQVETQKLRSQHASMQAQAAAPRPPRLLPLRPPSTHARSTKPRAR